MSEQLDIEPYIEPCTEEESKKVLDIIKDFITVIKNEHGIQ